MRLQIRQVSRVEGMAVLESHHPLHRVIPLFHWLRQTVLKFMLMGDGHRTTPRRCKGPDLLKDHVNILHKYAHQVDYQHTAIASHHDDHNKMKTSKYLLFECLCPKVLRQSIGMTEMWKHGQMNYSIAFWVFTKVTRFWHF